MDQIFQNMMTWAREAGDIQLSYFRGNDLDITNKLCDSDIVTNADKASEQCLLRHIAETYPDHSVLAEESGVTDREGEYRWVIDPLDGTTNFSAGLPNFCVSIGLQRHGVTVAGVVYAPYLREMFCAVRGVGAFLNGNPIRVSGKQEPSKAVVCTGFPVDKETNIDNNLDNFANIFSHVRGIRRLGSAAVDICYCAAGFLDGFWELNIHDWDVCAAELIVEEAGGKVTRFRDDRGVSTCVGTPAIHDWLLTRLSTTPYTGGCLV